MVALEAMATGCPVIASDVGGLTELIDHGRNGLLCHPGDDADLAEKLRQLLSDHALAARLGQQAAHDAAERFRPTVIAHQTAEFYQHVLRRWRNNAPRPRSQR